MRKEIVAFDFDGTLTTKDTLPEFIRFVKGPWGYYGGLLMCSPVLAAYVLKLVPNYRAKQRLFASFFRGMPYEEFCRWGARFAERIDACIRGQALQSIEEHRKAGRKIYVISASIEEWVSPWCKAHGIDQVIGTKIEVADGLVTGRFLTKNCYGQEKVNRLLEHEPHRNGYYLYAYGDSRGDRELLAFADEAYYQPFL